MITKPKQKRKPRIAPRTRMSRELPEVLSSIVLLSVASVAIYC